MLVFFERIDYSKTVFEVLDIDDKLSYITFVLNNTSLSEIYDSILGVTNWFDIEMKDITYRTSKEVMNKISIPTLSSAKTLLDLFNEYGMKIEVEDELWK